MNTEKIEKLKKGLTNSQIPESLREKIRQQISRLEAEDKANEPAPKEEAMPKKEVTSKVAKAPTVRKPTVRKPTVRKPRAKKVVEPKTSTTGKTTAMSLAKEIRKDGEKWTDAVKRAGMQMKKGTTEVKKSTKTEMQKLLALVKRRKELKGISGTNLKRDSQRKAKPRGARTVTNSGQTSNKYGTYDNKLGRKYTENRDNRTDRLAPKYPKNAPLLENGGGFDITKYSPHNAPQASGFGKIYSSELNDGNQYTYGQGSKENYGKSDDNRGYLYKENGIYFVNGFKNGKHFSETFEKFTDAKKFYLDKKTKSYELGGTVVTDLAGHTSGGDLGLNAGMPLSGFSNTAYTGLVGETGAMSSGEMFANGGGLPSGSEQHYVNYYLGSGTAQGIFEHGGGMHDYKKMEDNYANGGFMNNVYAGGGKVHPLDITLLWRGYASAILFAEMDYDTDEPLDNDYSIYDFDKKSEADAKKMLSMYYSKNEKAIKESGLDLETIGMDIWYTQGGHGAGFFDHSLNQNVEDKLTQGANEFGMPSIETNNGKVIIRGISFENGGFMNNVYAGGGEIRRFNRQEQMDSETREEVLDTLSDPDLSGALTNYLYGLFDGYDYSETENFHKEMRKLKSKDMNLYDRVNKLYKKIDMYKFENYDNYAKGGGIRIKNGQTYDYGRVWTNDHNQFDKGAEHEVNYRK